MDGHELTQEGNTYVRVAKPMARKLYNKGLTLWLIPNHVRFNFDAQWVRPRSMSNRDSGYQSHAFDARVREYEWYNCCAELGTYSRFYVRKEDLTKTVNEG